MPSFDDTRKELAGWRAERARFFFGAAGLVAIPFAVAESVYFL